MKIYIKSVRYGSDAYSSYTGMSLEIIQGLLSDLGCTNVQEVTKEEFDANTQEA